MSWKATFCALVAVLFLIASACTRLSPTSAVRDQPPAPVPTTEEKPTAVPILLQEGRTPTPIPPALSPTPTSVPAKSTPAPSAAQPKKGRIFLGYYVPYDTTSWVSLQSHANAIDYAALQIIGPDACGNIAPETDLTLLEFAHSHGVRVLPSVFTSSKWLNHRLLTDEATAANLVQQLTGYVIDEGYDGLDVDLEDVDPGDRKALTALISRLSDSLHKKGKLLGMAVPAKESDVTTGWAGAYDYAALAPYVDLFTIMSYAYTTSSTPPGSTAPIGWVDRVIAFATSQIPSEKVLLGAPFYGYDWNLTSGGLARALRYPQGTAIATKYGAEIVTDPTSKSAKFTYSARTGDQPPDEAKPPMLDHKIKARAKPACSAQSPTPAPKPTLPPKPTPIPAAIQEHVVWLEDTASADARLSLAAKYRAGGIGAWRLGQEDPSVWPLLESWRR